MASRLLKTVSVRALIEEHVGKAERAMKASEVIDRLSDIARLPDTEMVDIFDFVKLIGAASIACCAISGVTFTVKLLRSERASSVSRFRISGIPTPSSTFWTWASRISRTLPQRVQDRTEQARPVPYLLDESVAAWNRRGEEGGPAARAGKILGGVAPSFYPCRIRTERRPERECWLKLAGRGCLLPPLMSGLHVRQDHAGGAADRPQPP
jgi:hypothetical protein